MSHRLKPPIRPPLKPAQIVRTVLAHAGRSVIPRLLLLAAALYGIWTYAKPWDLGWLRPDEAADIAENFLLQQGVDLQNYTLIEAVEQRRVGAWEARGLGEKRFAVDPAVGYLLRYFRPGTVDGWSVAVSPDGQIYRVQREQLDDEPGLRLDRIEALHTAVVKLAGELGVPAYSLNLLSDTLIFQAQRNDWTFTFNWPAALGDSGRFAVTLAGDAISHLSFMPTLPAIETLPRRGARSSRVLGFTLILGGVFLMMHYHRTPLALKTAGLWGVITFFLILIARGLTFPQAVILMPPDIPEAGYLARIGLSAVVTALQSALLVGLVVATGEALARDVFRRSSTLSRPVSKGIGWRAAWAQAARWAFPAAAIVLIFESLACHYVGPVGLLGKVPGLIANTLSSPLPPVALLSEAGIDMVWEECVYRLWLLSLLMFWLRLPVLAVPLTAGAAAYFAGFDLAQFTTVGGLAYLAWGIIAGTLMLRSGIIAAMLFHLLVIVGYACLALIWMGFGTLMAAGIFTAIFIGVLVIARDRRPAPGAQLDILDHAA